MDIHTKVRGRFCSTSKEAERKPARCRVLSGLLDKLGWHAVTGRRLGDVMTVQRHDRAHPHIERTFIAVRAALPAANVAAFDTELEAITHAPVVDLAALDEFLSGWWRIATRAAADPADWQRIHQEAEQLQSGARSAARPWPRCWVGAGSSCRCVHHPYGRRRRRSPDLRSVQCPRSMSSWRSTEVLRKLLHSLQRPGKSRPDRQHVNILGLQKG